MHLLRRFYESLKFVSRVIAFQNVQIVLYSSLVDKCGGLGSTKSQTKAYIFKILTVDKQLNDYLSLLCCSRLCSFPCSKPKTPDMGVGFSRVFHPCLTVGLETTGCQIGPKNVWKMP